jgi:Bacteriocin-protection, YdeI or OmpD-Associated/Domain of unknown function (DUF1905)
VRRFEATVEARGRGGRVVVVPLDVPTAFGRARAPVRGSVNGAPFRSTIMKYGDVYYLGLNRELREAAGVDTGDTATVELELDDAPREVDVPTELREALDAEPEVAAFYDRLSLTHRKEYARWVAEAKREETRRRRVERAVAMLRDRIQHP